MHFGRSTYAPRALRIGFVNEGAPHARRLGFDLGVAEARRSAQLFGGTITVTELPRSRAPDAARLDVIVGGTTRDQCIALAAEASRIGAIFMNVGCADDALRGNQCRRRMFHVAPSDAMLRDAVAMSGAAGTATAWDSTLEKFGADTLNGRFRSATGAAMTSEAWLAWVAPKIAWEASLRVRDVGGPALTEYLERDSTQFDGHKGRPLGFRAWNHQLRQPLYVVVRGDRSTVIEEPATREGEPSRAALDRLGATAANTTCHLP
jgi:hypothetical protein